MHYFCCVERGDSSGDDDEVDNDAISRRLHDKAVRIGGEGVVEKRKSDFLFQLVGEVREDTQSNC